MLSTDELRTQKILKLALERFDPNLTDAEERVIRDSCDSAELADLPDDLPPRPDVGWNGQTVRPSFLRWLATDTDAAQHLYQTWIVVDKVRLPEELDLFNSTLQASLFFRYCLFEKAVTLSAAKLEHLTLRRCTLLADMTANHLHLRGSFYFMQVQMRGMLSLNSSRIDDRVELDHTEFTTNETALSIQHTTIEGNLDLTTEFRSAGVVSIWGTRIAGFLKLDGAKLTGKPISLALDGLRAQGIVSMRGGFEASGQILARAAESGQWLDMDGAVLTAEGLALTLEGAHIRGHALFRGGFSCSGSVYMGAAQFGGGVNFSGAKVAGTITLDNASVGSNLLFSDGFQSSGGVTMNCGEIKGSVDFDGAQLTNTNANVTINNVLVSGNMFFRSGFVSAGNVNLSLSEIRGQLELATAQFTSTEPCLLLHHLSVIGGLFLDEGFRCLGTVRLRSAKIGRLRCDNADISSLECLQSTLGELVWKNCKNAESVSLDLSASHISLLRDEAGSWPTKGSLVLNGLTVDDFEFLNPSRLEWLKRQKRSESTDAQPWMHAAKHLREKGYTDAAKSAIYHLRRNQALEHTSMPAFRPLLIFWKLAVAKVEEKPQRILGSVLAFVLLGTLLFWPYRAHFSETSDAAYQATHQVKSSHPEKSGAYPRFQPALYALENTLPVVRLGQDDRWAPDRRITMPRLYWALAGMRWFLILAGWIQGIVLAAALDSRFRS